MIPLHLYLSGFLSYRDPAELDFTSFDLACISGANGAGKSAPSGRGTEPGASIPSPTRRPTPAAMSLLWVSRSACHMIAS